MNVLGSLGSTAAAPVLGQEFTAPGIESLPAPFTQALRQLRDAAVRRDAKVTEVPAPKKLAPYAVALRAEVRPQGHSHHPVPFLGASAAEADMRATGRFILLYDPAGQEAWGGNFRVVIYIRAELEPEMGNDPLLASVAWTWLVDALEQHGVQHIQAGGTATRILSESFGSLEERTSSHEVELRASWTPTDRAFGTHMEAWSDMVCSFAGLPALPDGVLALPHIRRT